MNVNYPLEQSLKRGFIDYRIEGSSYDPKLIINRPEKQNFLLNILQDEIDTCEEFFFSVAFITQDGLNTLKTHLADLATRGKKGKLITSTYLEFNDPDMFSSLLQIPNIEVRVSEKPGFHAKGYLFSQKNYHSFIIGSSNLTMHALKINYEWNIRLTSYDHGEVIQQAKSQFQHEWENSIPLTNEWLEHYRKVRQPNLNQRDLKITQELSQSTDTYIVANKMQKVALKNLQELRKKGATRGIIISATGTGKTYLAALDVKQAKPKRTLFIVHREQILNDAKKSFKKVLREPEENFGIFTGNKKELHAKYLFATIQTISNPTYQQLFNPDDFDYILIDEVHKAGALSYRNTIDYFQPKFLLGMTATPERTDGFNIFELFDYNVAYEIRLQEALEEDLLCPFHYFGVTDYEKDGQIISEKTDLKFLTAKERVKFLIKKINYYGVSGNIPRGLVFCSRKEEARQLAQQFINEGIPSVALTGEDSITTRESKIEELENGKIHYIFTVDIFNEGIDIPKINQVIMLRNTQSSIIFIQQLGRGLRKDPSKNFVTIIDFIGNYDNNYMIPMALSGDVSHNKDLLRKATFDTNYITGLSAINFEEIAKEQIFNSIDIASLDSMVELKRIFFAVKTRLNRVPYLFDFIDQNRLDPFLIANKFTSYYTFLTKIKENEGLITAEENLYLSFLSREILSGIRKHEIILIERLLHLESLRLSDLPKLFQTNNLLCDTKTVYSVLRTLSLQFFTGGLKKTYLGAEIISYNDEQVILTPNFKAALKNSYFKKLLLDLLKTSFYKAKDFDDTAFLTRYAKYRRRDVLRSLNWNEQMVDQNIGGYVQKDGQFIIFVTLEKGDNFKGAQMSYEDSLVNESTLRWFTKSPRTLNSPEVKILQNPQGWHVHLFVKKSNDEGIDFYYLGEVQPIQETIKELKKTTQKGKQQSVVEMDLHLLTPISYKLYKYLT
ncbi:DEAD/DEAH box helicase [Enterococcus canintestini]|uniref:Helicase n=1 Tax=Enterococcus canintestini TaxID=317010 RepID=A0A1L8R8L6_9ENTE|nr:DEAD/DEAH box helicase [Enterococcus canintestini]OJG16111.1 hypothetical protein RU96_GL001608 [Enterococcus canintestini]